MRAAPGYPRIVMDTVIGLLELVAWIVAVLALAAAVTYGVRSSSDAGARRRPRRTAARLRALQFVGGSSSPGAGASASSSGT